MARCHSKLILLAKHNRLHYEQVDYKLYPGKILGMIEKAKPQGGGVPVTEPRWAVYRSAKENGEWITELVEGPMSRVLAMKRAEALQREVFEFEDEGKTFNGQSLPPIFLAKHMLTGQLASD